MTKGKQKREGQQGHSREQALGCIPVKNPQIDEELLGNGELRLLYQVQVRPWFQGVLKKITKKKETTITRTLQLDILGASVWKMIDGEKSVEKIIGEFQAVHQLNSREAEISVTSFFKELGKRGLLIMRQEL